MVINILGEAWVIAFDNATANFRFRQDWSVTWAVYAISYLKSTYLGRWEQILYKGQRAHSKEVNKWTSF